MCAEALDIAPTADPPRARNGSYGTIVVVGGGCYGAYYVRQLARADAAGALSWNSLLVVDRDPACRVAREARAVPVEASHSPAPTVVASDWAGFFRDYFDRAAAAASGTERDAIVPSPLMPHLMYEWLIERARARWPVRRIVTEALQRPPNLPWQMAGAGGVHFGSFAEWICPINCIEPPLCPEIRGPRTWSMPPALRSYVTSERQRGHEIHGPIVFHCEHRAYGVGMFDTAAVLEADRLVAEVAASSAAKVLVGTVSHCHGALALLAIGEPSDAPSR
ncbi:MAG: hypothetical protein ACR2OG_02650 [Gemmatimonadaceae bacterium]